MLEAVVARLQILVTDDDSSVRRAMRRILELHGHRVDLAANGREAVEMATERVPDLIVMDLSMPVMDGLTATRLLRSNPETKMAMRPRHPSTSRANRLRDACVIDELYELGILRSPDVILVGTFACRAGWGASETVLEFIDAKRTYG